MPGPTFEVKHNAPEVALALEQAPERARSEIHGALGRGAVELANEMKARAPKFRSTLTNAILAIERGPMEWAVSPRGVRYGVYVEEGTKEGGRPTLRETLDWLRLKRITPRTPGMSQRQLAALIRKRIAQRGIAAQPFAAPALEAKAERIHQLVRDAALRAIGGAE